MRVALRWWIPALACLCLASIASGQQLTWTITEISPKKADVPANNAKNPQSASGGRVNGLGAAGPNRPNTYYAASEWGGIFKTVDGGRNWTRLAGHAPQAAWDVEVDPSDHNRVYATSFYGGKVDSAAGINISEDGGVKWTPVVAKPPKNFCRLEESGGRDVRREEPSAFGIAIDPASSAIVYVGTNCGLAKSSNRGASWSYIDPTPNVDGADAIWDVVVHDGIIDLCGHDGHRRSIDGGASWTTASNQWQLTAGFCSIAVSPYEPDVLFFVVGSTVHESRDGGKTWEILWKRVATFTENRQGRIPFLATNRGAGDEFDLYYGDIELFRIPCRTPPPSLRLTPRCSVIDATHMINDNAHRDVGDIAFTPNGCPALFSNDGGVYRNTTTANPQCHRPTWTEATTTTRALWAWGLAEGRAAAPSAPKPLYFGNQDNGLFATPNARAQSPTWDAKAGSDVYEVTANANRVVYTRYLYKSAPHNRIFIADLGSGNARELRKKDHPPGEVVHSSEGAVIASYAGANYVVLTDKGVFLTANIDPPPRLPFLFPPDVQWLPIGANWTPGSVQDIKVAMQLDEPTFYVLGDRRPKIIYSSNVYDREGTPRYGSIFKHVGIGSGAWKRICRTPSCPPDNHSGFGILAVDPKNPDRLIASHLRGYHLGANVPPEAKMVRSYDGGKRWVDMPELDTLMRANKFHPANERGPTRNTWFLGYPQPTLVKFDPVNPNIIVAGGADSGVFISYDDGATWKLLTAGAGANQTLDHIPRPRFAHFDHLSANEINLYIASQGRGVWRINLKRQN